MEKTPFGVNIKGFFSFRRESFIHNLNFDNLKKGEGVLSLTTEGFVQVAGKTKRKKNFIKKATGSIQDARNVLKK